jgi:hypothetical protein
MAVRAKALTYQSCPFKKLNDQMRDGHHQC